MSTRTYNLRTRTDTAASAQPRMSFASGDRPRQPSVLARDVPPHLPSMTQRTEPGIALYSDIAASRPPSPRRETEAIVARDNVSNHLESGVVVENNNTPKMVDTTTSFEGESPELESNEPEAPWTTVQRRRARSLSSLDRNQTIRKKDGGVKPELTREQVKAVKEAATKLTAQQKETLRRRQRKVPVARRESVSSRGEGPSEPKGKGPDPMEWGGLNISRESLDLEAQAAALASSAKEPQGSTPWFCPPTKS